MPRQDVLGQDWPGFFLQPVRWPLIFSADLRANPFSWFHGFGAKRGKLDH